MDETIILINNSYSQILNAPSAILDRISDALTYKDDAITRKIQQLSFKKAIATDGAWRSKLDFQISILISQELVCRLGLDGFFPTGLLSRVLEVLNKLGVGYKIQDARIKAEPRITLKPIEQLPHLYPYQKEILEKISASHTGVIESATGTGKTRLILETILQKQVNTVVIVPSSSIQDQVYSKIEAYFGAGLVCVLTSKSLKEPLPQIRVVTTKMVGQLIKTGQIGVLFSDADMLIVDEVHHAGSRTFYELLSHTEHVYYRYGFTATNTRNDSKLIDLHAFISDVLYRYPYQRANEEGYLTPVEYVVHSLSGSGGSSSYQEEYKKHYCDSADFRKYVVWLINKIPSDLQILILVKRKDECGRRIYDLLRNSYESCAYISGDDKKSIIRETIADFNNRKIRILIGSSIIGEGIDIPTIDRLILAGGGKSEIELVQAIGRCVRLSPNKKEAIVHDFDFDGTKYLCGHQKSRIRTFKGVFGGKVARFKKDG